MRSNTQIQSGTHRAMDMARHMNGVRDTGRSYCGSIGYSCGRDTGLNKVESIHPTSSDVRPHGEICKKHIRVHRYGNETCSDLEVVSGESDTLDIETGARIVSTLIRAD